MAKQSRENESENAEETVSKASEPVGQSPKQVVVNKAGAPKQAVSALIAAYPDAKEIVVVAHGPHEIVGEVDGAPRKVAWK